MKKTISFILSAVTLLFMMGAASAATLNLSADKQDFSINDDFTIDLKIDSQGVAVNAAQGTVQYPSDILELRSIDRSKSVFNFWLQEPSTATKGSVQFTGGSTSGFSGQSLEVFKMVFRVKGVGTAPIVVADGAITASDGSGSNVLVGGKGIDIVVGGAGSQSNTQITPTIPPITPITRPATSSIVLPVKPSLNVGLYPDSEIWYNISAPFLVQWDLPSDITKVATSVDRNATSEPATSEGLFDNKTFSPLADGIWYLHVQFRNNIGWGQVAHYRIAIDTAPPVPFGIEFTSGSSSTNPNPTMVFSTADQPSGIESYFVQIGNEEPIPASEGSFILPLQSPGSRLVRVIARDKAGNTTEASADLNIVPIESPAILSVSNFVYVGEGGLEVKGIAVPGYTVSVSVKDKSDSTVASISVPTDVSGNWFVKLDNPLKTGDYRVEVIARDERGAQSEAVISDIIKAKTKPLLTVGNIGITPATFFIVIIILLIGSFIFGWYSNRLAGMQRGRKITIAKRDIVNVFNAAKKGIGSAITSEEKGKSEEALFHLKKVSSDIGRVEKYLIEGIEDIDNKK
ncbi:MAG: hypothetical protein PHG66_05595 [Candidatus Colwellbacteria bacterium]|nr:hypothetical protein [Candidatus Colwellbacteria bacterium]